MMYSHRLLSLLVLLLASFNAHASDIGGPGLWFWVFLIASFLLSGTLYGLSALLFIACVKKEHINKGLVYGVPTVIFMFCFVAISFTALAEPFVIAGILLGWTAAFALHHWAAKKWLLE
jgi:hypothetical protein